MSFVRRRFTTIFFTFALTLLLTALATAVLPTKYESTATLRLGTTVSGSINAVDYDIQYADRLMNTYSQIATSDALLREVQDRNGLSDLPDVKVDIMPNTELLAITASASSAELATTIAADTAAVLIDQAEASGARSDATITALTNQRDQLQQQVAAAETDFNRLATTLPAGSARLQEAADNLTNLRNNLNDLTLQIETRQALQAPTLAVMQAAETPTSPASPNLMINLVLGGFVGLVAGTALAFWWDTVDPRLQTEEQLATLTALPVLGVFSSARPPLLRRRKVEPRPVFADQEFASARRLRAAAGASPLLVASISPRDRSNEVAAQIAVSAARSGQMTVLVDANLHSPSVAEMFEIDDDFGFTNTVDPEISSWIDFDRLTRPCKIDNLDVIGSGPKVDDPELVVDHPGVKSLITWLQDHYDLVVINAPDLETSPDALVLAGLADEVVLVVHEGRTHRRNIASGLAQLKSAGAVPTGVVLRRYEP